MSDIVKMLRGVEFFHDIAEQYLERVAAISKVVEFPGRHDIFREFESAKEVYFIIDGRVSLVICTPPLGCRQLMEVGAGELIGWSPLVGRALLSDTARTLTPTTTVAMNGEQVLALCSQDPRFGFEFMHRAAQTLAARLNATRHQLVKMNGHMFPQVQLESD